MRCVAKIIGVKMSKKPIIGITMGDAAGIGPEIIIKTLSQVKVYAYCSPVVLGDARLMKLQIKKYRFQKKINSITALKKAQFKFGIIDVLDIKNINLANLKIGKIQKMCGRAAVEYVKAGIDLALKKEICAITTAPLCKEAVHKTGFSFAGHTELFASETLSKRYAMMFIGKKLKVVLVTTHLALKEVPKKIDKESVFEKIKLAHEILKKLKISSPRLAICGLNPHAGEGGILGKEEKKEIIPACQKAKQLGIKIYGPYSADTVFYYAYMGKFDVVIAMYHDQGLIPVKLLNFSSCVNVTLGLPFIRTSPGHGTAFDIAGKNIADPSSMIEAVKIAAKLAL